MAFWVTFFSVFSCNSCRSLVIPRILLQILLNLTVISCLAQTTTNVTPGGFRRILTADGIPSSEVYEVYQDKLGYLWLATDAGVCRYNGVKFTTFTTLNGLPDNTVFHFKEDSKGRIWVQTFTGEIAYFANNRFNPVAANSGLQALYGNGQKTGYTFFIDKYDNIVVGGLYIGGCYRLSPQENYSTLHNIRTPFSRPGTRQIWTDSLGQLYAIGEGLYSDPKAMIYHNGHEIILPIGYEMAVGVNMRVLLTRDSRILFSHRESIYEVDKEGNVKVYIMPGTVIGINQDATGDIWINMLQAGTLRFIGGNLDNNGISYLSGYSVSCVLQDAENGYWFSTVGQGLFYRAGLDFGYITVSEGLSPNTISCLVPLGNGKVYLGQAFSTITLISTRTATSSVKATSELGSVPEMSIEACGFFNDKLFANADRTYIVDSALNVVSKTGPFRHFKGYAIYPGEDTLVAFSHSTVTWCDRDMNIVKKCLAPERVTAACYQGNTLWLGGLNGLWRMSDTTMQYFGDKYPGLNTRIDDMVTDPGGRLWISTRGDGVFVLDNDTSYHFDQNSGLSSNTCRSITADDKGNIWVATNHGISVVSNYNRFRGEATVSHYNTTDGLLSDEVNFIEVKEDIVWMAGPDGLCWIPSGKLLTNLIPPPVYLNAVIRGNDTLLLKDSLSLDYGDERIRIICEGISLRNASRITYKYKLTGTRSDEWINTQSNEITFSNLDPGDYKFIIYALNSNGVPSVTPATLIIHVNTPFTKTWWFYSLAAMSAFALVFVLALYRLNAVRKKLALKSTEEQRMTELRLSALRAQMNPHFIFNAINSIQHYILRNDSDKAYSYLAKFSKLIRLVLDQSQHKTITLKQELEILGLYLELEQLRFEQPINVNINVDPAIDPSAIRLPGMLIQPYVENAVWHGLLPLQERAAVLTISIIEQEGNLVIVIEDNGIGREAAGKNRKNPERRSYGMQITSERLKLLNTSDFHVSRIAVVDTKDNDGNPSGTRVVIRISLSNLQP